MQEIRATFFSTIYEFDAENRLRQIIHTSKNHYPSETRFFAPKGWLYKLEAAQKDNEKSFNYKINYEYNAEKKQLVQIFDYENPSGDYVKAILYEFIFDEKTASLIQQRKTVQRSANSYGATTTYAYSQLAGLYLPHKISHLDDCWGSNSCANLQISINYALKGNIIAENLVDFTVRNSVWSHSYSKKYKYNDDNLLMAMSDNKDPNQKFRLDYRNELKNETKFDYYFEYQYDKKGNWIVQKTTSQNAQKQPVVKITRRQIIYY